MTAALEGGEWSAARPDRILPPGKTQYPFCRLLGGPQGWSGRVENLVPTHVYIYIYIYITKKNVTPILSVFRWDVSCCEVYV